MKTIKLPIKLQSSQIGIVKDLQRQYSSVVRWSFNRFQEGLKEKDIRFLSKSLSSIDDLNSWFVQCAILEGKQVLKSFQDRQKKNPKVKKLIFGGKRNLSDYLKGLISKEAYKNKKLNPLGSQGEFLHKGNRMFDFDFYNSLIIFKLNKKVHFDIILPCLHKKLFNELCKLQELTDLKKATVSVKLTSEFIYLTYEEPKIINQLSLLENRCIGIDLNPNHIGVSVLEFTDESFEVLEGRDFDLSRLTIKSNKCSECKETKYLVNKLKFETIEITKSIHQLSKKWNCKFIFIEDLNFKQGSSGLGKGFNRLTKNKWLRTLFTEQLEKRSKVFGQLLFKVNAAYSSTIGNLTQDYIDPINSSIEIGRRGYEVIILKNKKFYPSFDFVKTSFEELWKQMLKWDEVESWKELHTEIKNSKVKYRVSLEDYLKPFEVFSMNSIKSKIKLYCFT